MADASHLQHAAITEKIIGCAMRVHAHFGLGFPEIIYKRSLVIELRKSNLRCNQEVEKDIFYQGEMIGRRRLDLIVEDKILIELKAVNELDKKYISQVINYLKIFDLEVGLLFNFGCESLQFKRLVNTRKNPRNPFPNP